MGSPKAACRLRSSPSARQLSLTCGSGWQGDFSGSHDFLVHMTWSPDPGGSVVAPAISATAVLRLDRPRVVDADSRALDRRPSHPAADTPMARGRCPGERRVRRETVEGTPQGAGISPLLANIFLHYALDLWVLQWTASRGDRSDEAGALCRRLPADLRAARGCG